MLHEFGINACQRHRSVVYCQMYRYFHPRPALALGYCHSLCVYVSVCASVNPEIVCTITHHPFNIEPTNSNKRSKSPWLRSLLFWVLMDPWPSRWNVPGKSKFYIVTCMSTRINTQPPQLIHNVMEWSWVYSRWVTDSPILGENAYLVENMTSTLWCLCNLSAENFHLEGFYCWVCTREHF